MVKVTVGLNESKPNELHGVAVVSGQSRPLMLNGPKR